MPDFIQWWLDHWPLIPVLIYIAPAAWVGWEWLVIDPLRKRWRKRRPKPDDVVKVETVSEYGDPVIGFGDAGGTVFTGGKP